MHTIFAINRSLNSGAVSNFNKIWQRPVLNTYDVSRFSGRLNVSELILPQNINDKKYNVILDKTFLKLHTDGTRKIVLPNGINRKYAQKAGLYPQDLNAVFSAKAEEMVYKALEYTRNDIKDMVLVIYSEKLTKDVQKIIYSFINATRYVYVNCGKDTENISQELLREYGISMYCSPQSDQKKVLLLLFSPIDKQYLKYLSPNVIINICGQEIDEVGNVFVISGNSVDPHNDLINEFPEGIDKSAAAALLLENGWISTSDIRLSDIKFEYFF